MKVDVLLGLQWGDEGKGKVVDVLTPKYDVVARFQGGPNAGHTLEFEGQKYVLRSIPSGIFQGNKVNIIGNGVVLDPALFKAEAEALEASGHPLKERLHISKKAHLILPTHRILDAAYEAAKGDAKVGTTGKGIGPTYTDKVSRNGVRVGDILHNFDQKYAAAKARHEQILKSLNRYFSRWCDYRHYQNPVWLLSPWPPALFQQQPARHSRLRPHYLLRQPQRHPRPRHLKPPLHRHLLQHQSVRRH